jgi:acetyl-CoA C-acetyltransferase
MENMSAAPFLAPSTRWGHRLGDAELRDCILQDGLVDPGEQCHMAITAEGLAQEFEITRRQQDEFAAGSQRKAAAAIRAGSFQAEIVPVSVPRKKGGALSFHVDEFPKPDTTVEGLAKLRPAFRKDGTITAGNASGINDGAAAVVLTSAEEAKARGIIPMAQVVSYASTALEPLRMGMGPVSATRKALGRAGLELQDIRVIELNEAFAAQSLAVLRELAVDPGIVNLNGGAIALGHPLGASGARIMVTLVHLMADRGLPLGLATLCVGGGQGMALILKLPA